MKSLFSLSIPQARILGAYDQHQYVVVGIKNDKGAIAYALRHEDASLPDIRIDGRAVIALKKRRLLAINFTSTHSASRRGLILDRTHDGEVVLHQWLVRPATEVVT